MSARIPFQALPKDLIGVMMQVENYVNHYGFSTRLLELLRLRASQLNGCAYCVDMHYQEALAADEDARRLNLLAYWRDTPLFEAKERAALAWCEALTLSQTQAELDPLFAELQQHFSDADISHLTLAITQINAWNRLAKSCGFPAGHYRAQAS